MASERQGCTRVVQSCCHLSPPALSQQCGLPLMTRSGAALFGVSLCPEELVYAPLLWCGFSVGHADHQTHLKQTWNRLEVSLLGRMASQHMGGRSWFFQPSWVPRHICRMMRRTTSFTSTSSKTNAGWKNASCRRSTGRRPLYYFTMALCSRMSRFWDGGKIVSSCAFPPRQINARLCSTSFSSPAASPSSHLLRTRNECVVPCLP